MVNGVNWHCINSKKVHSHCTTCSPLCSPSLSPYLTSDFPSMCSEVSSSDVFSALPPWPSSWLCCIQCWWLHAAGAAVWRLPDTGMGLDQSLLRKLQIFSHLLSKEYFWLFLLFLLSFVLFCFVFLFFFFLKVCRLSRLRQVFVMDSKVHFPQKSQFFSVQVPGWKSLGCQNMLSFSRHFVLYEMSQSDCCDQNLATKLPLADTHVGHGQSVLNNWAPVWQEGCHSHSSLCCETACILSMWRWARGHVQVAELHLLVWMFLFCLLSEKAMRYWR